MSVNNRIVALLLICAACGPAAAQDAPEPESQCGEAQAHQRYKRNIHFAIQRGDGSFEYQCTLRKNKYRKKDPEVFRRQCEAFVNEYIDILNRCEDAGIPRFVLDESREELEKKESKSKRILKYTGIIEMG